MTTPGRVIFNAEVERALDEATGGDFEDHPFLNKTLTKRELDAFIGDLVEHYGPNTIAAALDVIKSVTFRFATRAGHHDLEERHRAAGRQGGDPRRVRGRGHARSAASTTAA